MIEKHAFQPLCRHASAPKTQDSSQKHGRNVFAESSCTGAVQVAILRVTSSRRPTRVDLRRRAYRSCRNAQSASTASTVCSGRWAALSITMASGAGRSGATARVLSCASRCLICASTDLASSGPTSCSRDSGELVMLAEFPFAINCLACESAASRWRCAATCPTRRAARTSAVVVR